MTTVTPGTVQSADGATIAFERSGAGPALILIDAAGGFRELGPHRSLAAHLAPSFTVFTYDRRGRGESTDTKPYAVEREVEDLEALIQEAGGAAFVYGFSSGALLALHAATSGLAIPKLAIFEPPIGSEEDRAAEAAFTAELEEVLAAGRNWDAAVFFNTEIAVPPDLLEQMSPSSRAAMESSAHTLLDDCAISVKTSLELVASVPAPTLVLDSAGSTGDLTGWASDVVNALRNGSYRSLAGGWHGVPDVDLARVLTEFLTS